MNELSPHKQQESPWKDPPGDGGYAFGSDTDQSTYASSQQDQPESSQNATPSRSQIHRQKRRKRKEQEVHNPVIIHETGDEGPETSVKVLELTSKCDELASVASDEASPGAVPSQRAIRAQPRRKRGKKVEMESTLYANDSIHEDIRHLKSSLVSADESTADSPKIQVWHSNVQSQPVGKIFVECKGGFKALDSRKYIKSSVKQPDVENGNTAKDSLAIELGLSLHRHVRQLANYCHGVLAGFALWHCVMVYQLTSSSFTLEDFVKHYSLVAAPAQALFYFLLAVSLVSVMGRCDVGNDGFQNFQLKNTLSSSSVAMILYLATLALSLCIANIDEKLAQHGQNTWALDDSELQTWKNVNLCRCLGAIIAWFILAMSPDTDRLYDNVKNLLETD